MATLSLSYVALQAHKPGTTKDRREAKSEQTTECETHVSAPEAARIDLKYQVLVADVMTTKVVTIGAENLLSEAYVAMMKAGVRRLPVLDDDGILVGIVTLGDLREARPTKPSSPSLYELNYLIASMHVSNLMTHNPYTVQADQPLAAAAHIMSEHKIGALPVLNSDGALVGIVTESDIFRKVVEYWD